MIVAKITYRDAGGTLQSAWFSSGRTWRTAPTDTPASTVIRRGLLSAGSISRSLFGAGRLGGAIDSSFGVMSFANAGGEFDGWREYSLAGHPVELWHVPAAGAPSSEWTQGPVLRMLWCSLRLAPALHVAVTDRMQELDVPLAATFFAGTGGLEGDSFVTGVRKPWGAGDCLNVEPVLISSTLPIYVVNDGSIDSATIGRYDRNGGAALAREANYTSEASLFSSAPSAGAVKRYPAGGAIRTGTASSYLLTCDISFGGTTSKLAHRVVESMALRAGIASGDISSADMSALDSSPTINAGYFCRDAETARSAISKIASGGGIYAFFDMAGVLRVGKLALASGSPVYAFHERSSVSVERDVVPGLSAPVWRVTARWRKRWRTQGDVSGTASLVERQDLALAWDEHVVEDSAVLADNPYAIEQTLETYCLNLDSVAAPSTEAVRRLALVSTLRAVYRVTVQGISAALLAVDLGAVVSLTMRDNRMGLGSPGLFRVISIDIDFGADRATYSLWG